MYVERNEEARKIFIESLNAIPTEKTLFVDETGISDNEVPAYGWNYSGLRAPGQTRGKRWSRVSIAGVCRENKITGSFVLKGAFDGLAFKVFVESSLVPNIHTGDVVVMDNARIHKNPEIKELIEKAGGRLLFQPPYSPDLNPIEHLWTPLKSDIRKKIQDSIGGENFDVFEIATEILKLKIA